MLISFSANNFRSIKNTQTISLEATSYNERKILPFNISDKKNIVPIAVIYGANAAGKSNVIKILKALEWFVLISNKLDPGDNIIANDFFAFDLNYRKEPTTFEIDFIAKDGIRYRFKVSFTQKEVLYESLYQSINRKKETWQKLYIREKGKEMDFGEFLKGPQKQIEELLIENQLFLSKAANHKNAQLRPVFEYFKDSLYVNILTEASDELQLRMLARIISENKKYLDLLNNILEQIDVGILGIDIAEAKLPQGLVEFGEKVKDEDKKQFLDMMKFELKTQHRLFDQEKEIGIQNLSLKEASEGTQKFISLFRQIISILEEGGVWVIDELDKSFHPLLTQLIIRLFTNPETNPNKAQLLFSTHDATLIDTLDKDTIYIIQKNTKGETQVRRVSEQRGLRNDTPLEKWYMEGRIGGIPNIIKNKSISIVEEFLQNSIVK